MFRLFLAFGNAGEEGMRFSGISFGLFMGLLLRFVSRDERRQLRAAFTQMGEAVRDRAEALWTERQNTPS